MCLRERGGGGKGQGTSLARRMPTGTKQKNGNKDALEESSLENGPPDDVHEFGSELNFNS